MHKLSLLVIASVVSIHSALAPPPRLAPLEFKPLPLGTFKASGWLLRQLIQQANSLSGHLALFWRDVNNSVWVGGTDDKSGAGEGVRRTCAVAA